MTSQKVISVPVPGKRKGLLGLLGTSKEYFLPFSSCCFTSIPFSYSISHDTLKCKFNFLKSRESTNKDYHYNEDDLVNGLALQESLVAQWLERPIIYLVIYLVVAVRSNLEFACPT